MPCDSELGLVLVDIPRSEALQQCATAVRVVGLDINAVVGIAFAAFTIGILLTGALWLIHTRTGTTLVQVQHSYR